jgi:hypothetical protein
LNNPLNRRMFRQAGMSKQPMGILASSPELMTTAQKAMMKGQPVKAQSGLSANTKTPNLVDSLFGTNIGSWRYMQPGNTIIKDVMSGFSFGGSDPEKTYETKVVKEGDPPVGFIETTKKPKPQNQSLFGVGIVGPDGKPMKEGESIDSISGIPLKDIQKVNKEFRKKLTPKKDDSQFTKDIKGVVSSISGGYDKIIDKVDDTLNYFRTPKEKETSMQERLDAKAEVDPRYQFTDQFAGPQRLEPPKKGEERGLVDPNVLSPDDPRFPEAFPESKPEEVLGLSVINKIKEDAKNPKGTTTKGADDALGISDLSFKDRVKARREIISAALGRDVSEKDVRTDLNYNLIMTGLLVAAGESPNAMTNIAKGLAAGLAGYGKAKGEATEAKRKEDIAVGLAAVEQTFKETEAEKSRDKKPDTIRTAELLLEKPELIPVIKSISSKGKTLQEIRSSAVLALTKADPLGRPPKAEDVNRLVNLMLGTNISETNFQPTSTFRVDQKVVGTDAYKPGNIIPYKGYNYKVSDDGLTLNLDTTQKSS